MGLLKPAIIFIVGYFFIHYFKENQNKISNIPIIGGDLKKLVDSNMDYMILTLVTFLAMVL